MNNANETDSSIIPADSPDGEDILTYYQHDLAPRGWKDYKLDAAQGATGSSLEWTSNGHYFRAGYKQIFKGSADPNNIIGQQLFIIHN